MGRRPRREAGGIDGFVVLDKPSGITSHDAVAEVRRRLGQRRAGHGGTLDPGATGVLVVGLGRATRLLRFVSALPKTYTGEVVLGVATSTLDDAGEVVATYEMSGLSLEEVRHATAGLTGQILQVPPMVSALKVGGRRLHELARAGVELPREPRPVEVTRFDVRPTAEPGVFAVEVTCSSGTYVRSLAADLGTALHGGAHLRALRRTSIGTFVLEESSALESLCPGDVRPSAGLLAHLPSTTVPDELVAAVAHGKVLERSRLELPDGGPAAVLASDGELVAVYEPWRDGLAKPLVVLVSPPEPGGAPSQQDAATSTRSSMVAPPPGAAGSPARSD